MFVMDLIILPILSVPNFKTKYIFKTFFFRKKTIIKEKNDINKWFNNELNEMEKEKNIMYQKAKFENSDNAWAEYSKLRNKYKVKTVNEEFNYINNRINNDTDQKQMWNEIKALVMKKKPTVIKTVIFNPVEYKDKTQIANQFNNYFVGV